MTGFWKSSRPYIISVFIALAVSWLCVASNSGALSLYDTLKLPAFSPPSWLFPVVWTILFLLMGISAAMIWESGAPGAGDALFVYGTQLIVSFLWTLFFFIFESFLLAFFWLVFLFLLTLLMISKFGAISKKAAKLQIPYAVWSVFAGYLNFAICVLNG